MNQKINQLLRRLRLEYSLLWVLPLALVTCYETGLLSDGVYIGDARMEYICQTVGILLTVGLIPFSLRLFSLSLARCIRQQALSAALRSYHRWSQIRVWLLLVPLLLNLSFYYLTLNTTGLFCAAMVLLASLFCVPTRKRLLDELDLTSDDDNALAL